MEILCVCTCTNIHEFKNIYMHGSVNIQPAPKQLHNLYNPYIKKETSFRIKFCLNLEYYKLVKRIFNTFQNQHKSIAIYENTVPKSIPQQGEILVYKEHEGDSQPIHSSASALMSFTEGQNELRIIKIYTSH